MLDRALACTDARPFDNEVWILSTVRRALVAYSMSSTFVQTTLDYLRGLKQFSGFDADYVHSTHQASIGFDFDGYDVIFHSYCSRFCFEGYVSESYRERLRNFSGIKVLAVQDEYDNTNLLKAAIKDLKFDIVLTCVPQDSLDYVYPRAEFPNVEFITVFTGYVPDNLASTLAAAKPLAERPIFIGYRGRDIGGRFGRLGFDKFEIGRRMRELCDARGIKTDIAMDEASRIYGMAWFEFVGNCRAMLGSESGSNVFDFDGRIDARFKEMTAANGGIPPSYADFLPTVAARDGEIDMGQISPRVFECAMMRTPMVLFKGRYSDAIRPEEHYISLEKDFSNVDDVLAQLEDLPALEAMTQRAFDHLVGSGAFTYKAFYGRVSAAIERLLLSRSGERALPCGEQQISAELFDPSGLLLETATPWPLGGKSFKARQDIAEAALYRREFDGLIKEFGRLRLIFEAEILRLHTQSSQTLSRLGAATEADGTLQPSWSWQDCGLARLLRAYDDELATTLHARQAVGAAFSAALLEGEEDASAETRERMLGTEKDGYSRMIEWIRRLNETYDAERHTLQCVLEERISLLRNIELSGLSRRRRLALKLLFMKIAIRNLIMSSAVGRLWRS